KKGNHFGFIVVEIFSIKVVAWHYKGRLLADPIISVLAKHGLQRKIGIN
ncbi:hypothetical protein VP01_10306g1, partial [Puccinia sorghi]